MSQPGWYPDPGGVPHLYRYWDGQAWTNQLSPQPGALPPAPQQVSQPSLGQRAADPQPAGRQSAGPPSGFGPAGGATAVPPRRSGRRWLIALIAVAIAVVVVIVLAVRGLSGTFGGTPGTSGGNPSGDVCPRPEADSSPTPQPGDGRVHSGPLSYPMLPAPWGAPLPADDVPFGRNVLQQFVQTEQTSSLNWGAAVMVGELVAGDGFFAPKDGAEIVLRCVTGTFYGNNAVTRHDTKSQALTVDGHDGWLMESDLTFSIPDLEATNEVLTVVIVDLGSGSAGLFASSVPGNAPQYTGPARLAMEGLRVS